ncbi:hypothetical protein AYO20_03313 [Fonsecaea nubica]|uniref:Uncharacterized protein n=1 Tax=Fonsecaea nubica TaxID=856822 RepID=A0A178D7X1_9EURO|nr:hypothetical protein AYO20_03313 [Fonsecaea nubica]OAL37464.1 hypothetical protein AYO20_03313 [Fonsecaea nubica]
MGPGIDIDLEAARLANMQEKQKLLESLNLLPSNVRTGQKRAAAAGEERTRPAQRQRGATSPNPGPSPGLLRTASRASARIAAAAAGGRLSYREDEDTNDAVVDRDTAVGDDDDHGNGSWRRSRNGRGTRSARRSGHHDHLQRTPLAANSSSLTLNTLSSSLSLPTTLPSLLQHYNLWTPSSPLPTQDPETDNYHFVSHPAFRPNKSPLSILLEGAFGGGFFSPWPSRTLGVTLVDDHLSTLPGPWLAQLHPAEKYLTSPSYDAELNRHGRACGQTLAQWEDAGWINFRHDARGWFEWYIRFWLGRRLDDGEDERQVGRWLRCVGPKGRWKRMLLKKYVEMGVRSVFDDDDDDDGDAQTERKVSPVIHQTCLQWGYQVTQADLDDAWGETR